MERDQLSIPPMDALAVQRERYNRICGVSGKEWWIAKEARIKILMYKKPRRAPQIKRRCRMSLPLTNPPIRQEIR